MKSSKDVESDDSILEEDDTESDFDVDTTEVVKTNVCSISRPELSKLYFNLIENFELSDVKKIRSFIRAWQKPELKPIIETVIEADPKKIKKLRAELNKFIKSAED